MSLWMSNIISPGRLAGLHAIDLVADLFNDDTVPSITPENVIANELSNTDKLKWTHSHRLINHYSDIISEMQSHDVSTSSVNFRSGLIMKWIESEQSIQGDILDRYPNLKYLPGIDDVSKRVIYTRPSA